MLSDSVKAVPIIATAIAAMKKRLIMIVVHSLIVLCPFRYSSSVVRAGSSFGTHLLSPLVNSPLCSGAVVQGLMPGTR